MKLSTFFIPGDPVAKPRQTQRDRWKKRPCVMRYRAWADMARFSTSKAFLLNPIKVNILAVFQMPQSWPKKKKAELAGKPHRQKPDWDNIGKAVSDALWGDDSVLYDVTVKKVWEGNHKKGTYLKVWV